MPKFGLRKSGVYSDKSDEEEMDINQENSVEQLRTEASQACATLAGSVDQLRNETSEVCSNIVSGVNENFVSKEDLQRYHEEIMKEFGSYNRAHADIISSLNSLKNATLYFKKELQILSQKGDASNASTSINNVRNPIPSFSDASIQNPQVGVDDNASTTTRYDNDHDVIMRTTFSGNVPQVPDPGLFTGDVSETELFCQLCGDTFKTYPCKFWPEESKINFVQSRLREAARSWYQNKYPAGTSPISLNLLLKELKESFPDFVSKKLKKINLINIKHSYGKINDYIDSFRKLTTDLGWAEEPLVLFFYNGLHPKFKEEINKMDKFPDKLEEITTKCILIEASQDAKNKINQLSGYKNDNKRNTHSRSNNNNKNKNNDNNNFSRNNNLYNKSKINFSNNNNNNNHITEVKKINSKN